MAVEINYTLPLNQDGNINVPLAPPVSISGWSIAYSMSKYRGGDALVSLSMASGYVNVSGLNILNATEFQIRHTPAQVSGLDPGAYPFEILRTDSGFVTPLAYGFRSIPF